MLNLYNAVVVTTKKTYWLRIWARSKDEAMNQTLLQLAEPVLKMEVVEVKA
jgi:hypothetical protein